MAYRIGSHPTGDVRGVPSSGGETYDTYAQAFEALRAHVVHSIGFKRKYDDIFLNFVKAHDMQGEREEITALFDGRTFWLRKV